jgi:hypothetical protein
MKIKLISLIVALLSLCNVSGSAADLVLADKGKTDYQIVLPVTNHVPEIGKRLEQIARLARTAFATNGFDIQVVPEDKLDLARPGIFLGDTDFARKNGIDVSNLAGWTYIQKAIGSNLVIAGFDQPDNIKPETNRPHSPAYWLGTVKGAADFLKQYAGVRFVLPGETGVEFLKMQRIAVPAGLNVTKTPAMIYNTCGVTRDIMHDIANNMFPMVGMHFGCHTWMRPYAIPAEKYRESHPEYFALINGNRCCNIKGSDDKWMEQYCISNPDVEELIGREVIYWLDRGYAMADLGQPDGFQACQCDNCRKLYNTGDDWGEKIWIFNRRIAERIAKERPGKKVMIIAYGPTRNPPKSFKKFPKNTVIQIVGASPELLAEWNKLEVPGGYTTFTSSWGPYGMAAFTPKITPRKAESFALMFYTNRFQGFFMDGGYQSFGLMGLEGPSYYVYGRMLDDPSTNRALDLVNEFYSGAFCEAAPWMTIFFNTLYNRLELFSAGTTYVDLEGKSRQVLVDPIHYLGCIYTPDLLSTLDNILSQAEKKTRSDKVKRRVALVRFEFEYVKNVAQVVYLYNAFRAKPDADSRARLLDALDDFRARVASSGKAKKELIPDWPEMPSLGALPKGWLDLTAMGYGGYKDTVFGWDTKALRNAPLPGAKRLAARPADGPVTLDAPGWNLAAPETLGAMPGAGNMPARKTSLRALYDKDHFYLLVESELPGNAGAFQPLAGREDDRSKQESLDIAIDPFGRREKFYHFIVGPLSEPKYSAANGFIVDPVDPRYMNDDPIWNAPWSYETRIEAGKNRWLAFLKIPYKSLGVEEPSAGSMWCGNAGRIHVAGPDKTELSIWSPGSGAKIFTERNAFGEIIFDAGCSNVVSNTSKNPVQETREQLYRSTFDIPAEWKKLPHQLPSSLGPWMFGLDPADRGVSEEWYKAGFNDSNWTPISVPSFWAETETGTYLGCGWYRTSFTIPAEWKGKSVKLLFGSIDGQAWIYVNGTLVKEHSEKSEGAPIDQFWDKPFAAEIPPELLNCGAKNLLAIRVQKSKGNAGIWRPVIIHAVDAR